MEQGPHESFLLDQARKNRMPPPDVISNAPELWEGSRLYYDAFLKLSSCRINGMGVGRIPYNEVARYGRDRRMSAEEIDVLWLLMSEMDAVYLKVVNKKPDTPINKTKPPLKSVKQFNAAG